LQPCDFKPRRDSYEPLQSIQHEPVHGCLLQRVRMKGLVQDSGMHHHLLPLLLLLLGFEFRVYVPQGIDFHRLRHPKQLQRTRPRRCSKPKVCHKPRLLHQQP
jgi:hypothetical protein